MAVRHNFIRIVLIGWLAALLATVALAPAAAQDTAPDGRQIWDGQRRFTFVVMGIDRRPGGQHGLEYLTDVLMVVSVDPATQSIGVLRLPRDLQVTRYNSTDYERVNTLLTSGEQWQEGYGPYLVMDTLEYNLGIYIDAYVIFDFEAFTTIVDAIGGIDVDVPYPIYDPRFPNMNYGYDPLQLSAGMHHFNGYDALRYVRTRHADNDFLRGERQLQVLMAVRDKVLQGGTATALLAQAPALLQQLSTHVVSDVTTSEMVFLGQFAANVPTDNIHMAGVENQYLLDLDVPGQGRIYVLNRENLGDLMVSVFGENYAQ